MLPLQRFHALKTKSPPQAARVLQNMVKMAQSYKRPLHRATRVQSWVSFLLLISLAQVPDSCCISVAVAQATARGCDFEVSCTKLEFVGQGAP